jgi:hypothetical protein
MFLCSPTHSGTRSPLTGMCDDAAVSWVFRAGRDRKVPCGGPPRIAESVRGKSAGSASDASCPTGDPASILIRCSGHDLRQSCEVRPTQMDLRLRSVCPARGRAADSREETPAAKLAARKPFNNRELGGPTRVDFAKVPSSLALRGELRWDRRSGLGKRRRGPSRVRDGRKYSAGRHQRRRHCGLLVHHA